MRSEPLHPAVLFWEFSAGPATLDCLYRSLRSSRGTLAPPRRNAVVGAHARQISDDYSMLELDSESEYQTGTSFLFSHVWTPRRACSSEPESAPSCRFRHRRSNLFPNGERGVSQLRLGEMRSGRDAVSPSLFYPGASTSLEIVRRCCSASYRFASVALGRRFWGPDGGQSSSESV